MKLLDIIIFALAFCLFIIGMDQAITVGFSESYWIFMFSLMLLFLYRYRKANRNEDKKKKSPPTKRKRKN